MSQSIHNNKFLGCFLCCYSTLVTDTEHFIIRTVRIFRDRISEENKNLVKKLFFQEGSHAIAHAQINDELLCHKGYPVKSFGRFVSSFTYGWLEKILPDKILLSSASAIEHLNSELSTYFLNNDSLLKTNDNKFSSLLAWHFSEEIDHKSAVYNVCQDVGCGYLIRTLGLLTGALGFFFFLTIGTFYFSFKDRSLFTFGFWFSLVAFFFGRRGFFFYSMGSLYAYLRYRFHPEDINNNHLVDKGIRLSKEYKWT